MQYILSTSSTGGAALLKEVDDNTAEATVLTWSDELGATRQMHFTLEVRGGGTAPTQLVGSVNGSRFRPLTPGLGFFGGLGLCQRSRRASRHSLGQTPCHQAGHLNCQLSAGLGAYAIFPST